MGLERNEGFESNADCRGAESRPKAVAPSIARQANWQSQFCRKGPGRPFGPAIGLALVCCLFVARQ